MNIETSTTQLTPSQMQAVEHFKGPLLVLAGPGSGKTRVITQRIARLIERGVSPREILAITFTNKAAREMADRLTLLLPGTRIWVSTFHKFCARILRERGAAVGLGPNFTIFDTADQKQLIREVLNEENIDAVIYSPGKISQRISSAKNKMQTAEQFAQSFEEQVGDHFQAVVARVYPIYQRTLLRANGVDFDDLLMHVVTLLRENPEIRHQLDERFRFILVDEYQDTNIAQYSIVTALSQRHQNVCVTGDPDQSIYGWRGAEIENILRFERDFPSTTLVKLQENFRSTKNILRAADSLIAHNKMRKKKSLITDNADGEAVELLKFDDGRAEADLIALQIHDAVSSGQRQWSDFAIFYRVNALSRELEFACARNRVPYQVAAGVAFYDRAEVKDLLAYLRVLENPADRVALRRIINKPLRGLGKMTQQKLMRWADEQRIDGLEAAARAEQIPTLGKRAVTGLKAFANMIRQFSLADAGSIAALLHKINERTGYTRPWESSQTEQDRQRLANVEELITAAAQYDRLAADYPENDDAGPTLQGFLETTSLASDTDGLAANGGQVTLMTLHAAKGLEFPVVYILGVEQNLIPHERSLMRNELSELEEERRLLFVGMTRAEQKLYLTETKSREIRGRLLSTITSQFRREIDLQVTDLTGAAQWESLNQSTTDSAEQKPLSKKEAHLQKLRAMSKASLPKLMTAADMLDGKRKEVNIPQGFGVGDKVRHPRYGLGTIIATSGLAKQRQVTVAFESPQQTQTFSLAHAPLQPVGLQ